MRKRAGLTWIFVARESSKCPTSFPAWRNKRSACAEVGCDLARPRLRSIMRPSTYSRSPSGVAGAEIFLDRHRGGDRTHALIVLRPVTPTHSDASI